MQVKKRQLEFSYWPMYRTNRRYGLHSLVYVTNPWAVIESSIKAYCPVGARPEALASLSQASYLYRAAIAADEWAAKPLLLYYAFMNLGKAYGLTQGQATSFDQAHHGISSRRRGLGVDDAYLRIFQQKGSQGENLFAHFLEALSDKVVSGHEDVEVSRLLPQIVAGHRLWCDATVRQERFVPIKDILFMFDGSSREVWLELHLYAQDLSRLSLTRARLLEGTQLVGEVREVASDLKDGAKRILRFEQLTPISYTHRVSDVIPKTVDGVRHSLWATVRSDPPFRKYYLYVAPKNETGAVFPQLASIYAVIYYLGSVTRYRPQHFEGLVAGKFGPLIQELLTAQPAQFLYLLASEFARREVTRPAIV